MQILEPESRMRAASGGWIQRAEWIVGLSITLTLVVAHIIFWVHAGALWRDEINTLNVATQPTLRQFWTYLKWDSCPPLWPSLLRLWAGSESGSPDLRLRILGMIVGLSVLGALWWNARQTAKAVPLCSMVMLAASPTMILYGDSLRAYGLGTALMVVMIGMIWKVVDRPTPTRIILATLVSVLSVHTLYYNSVLLFALCTAGAIVGWRRADWKRPFVLLGMGFVCALSIYLPYHERIAGTYEWSMTLKIPINVPWLLFKFHNTVQSSGAYITWVWFGLLIVSIHFCFRQQLCSETNLDSNEKDLSLFIGTALVLGVTCYLSFLLALSYITEPWYYISIMGYMAALFDVATHLLVRSNQRWRIGRLGFVSIVAILISTNVYNAIQTRQTNVDLIAERLMEATHRDDLIVVSPWYLGITFMRYYKGQTPWITLPLIDDHLVDRRDLIKQRMTERDASKPFLERVASTLNSGHNVWFVGKELYLSAGPFPRELPPPPEKPSDWLEWPHIRFWMYQTARLFQTLPVNIQQINIAVPCSVNRYENLDLLWVTPREKEAFRQIGE